MLVLGAGVSAGNVESGRQVVPESQRRTQLWRQVPGLRLQSQGSSHQGFIVLSKVKGHIPRGPRESEAELCVAFLFFFNGRATRFSDKYWELQELRFKACHV